MVGEQKIALITGAARRLGAAIATTLHAAGYGVVAHYRHSANDVKSLTDQLNTVRRNSAWAVYADFQLPEAPPQLIEHALACAGRLDVLVNNAACFYPTPFKTITASDWDDVITCNLKAPFFLIQAASKALQKSHGAVVNIVDVYAECPLPDFLVYSISKSGLFSLTRALAKELAPMVRVNGISPGTILWREDDHSTPAEKKRIINAIPLQKKGTPAAIAKLVLFLSRDADYMTGEVIRVDGGSNLV